MKNLQWLFWIICLSFSLSYFASYQGSSLTIEGLPNSALVNVQFDQAITEYIDAPNAAITIHCGTTGVNGYLCGFVNAAFSLI
jgi:uncharacterized membrane protein